MADITQGCGQFRLPDRTVGKQFKFELPDRTSTKSSTGGQTKERELDDSSTYELPPNYADMDVEMKAEKAKYSGAAAATNKQRIFKKPLFKAWASAKGKRAVSAKMFAFFSRQNFIFHKNPVIKDNTLGPRAKGSGRPSPWVQNELVEENGALQLAQSTEVYEVAKEAHSGSEDDIDEDLADRMDMCEV